MTCGALFLRLHDPAGLQFVCTCHHLQYDRRILFGISFSQNGETGSAGNRHDVGER